MELKLLIATQKLFFVNLHGCGQYAKNFVGARTIIYPTNHSLSKTHCVGKDKARQVLVAWIAQNQESAAVITVSSPLSSVDGEVVLLRYLHGEPQPWDYFCGASWKPEQLLAKMAGCSSSLTGHTGSWQVTGRESRLLPWKKTDFQLQVV